MESWHKEEILLILNRIQQTIETIVRRNESIETVHDYLSSESKMEKLDAACMLIQTIGENVKALDHQTTGTLLASYPQIPWKRVMRMRDYISIPLGRIDQRAPYIEQKQQADKHHRPANSPKIIPLFQFNGIHTASDLNAIALR